MTPRNFRGTDNHVYWHRGVGLKSIERDKVYNEDWFLPTTLASLVRLGFLEPVKDNVVQFPYKAAAMARIV